MIGKKQTNWKEIKLFGSIFVNFRPGVGAPAISGWSTFNPLCVLLLYSVGLERLYLGAGCKSLFLFADNGQ